MTNGSITDGTSLRHRIGAAIRIRRQNLGITLQALSDTCGVTVDRLSRIERGEASPRLDTLEPIAEALDLKFDIRPA